MTKTKSDTCPRCGFPVGAEYGFVILWGGGMICNDCGDRLGEDDEWDF